MTVASAPSDTCNVRPDVTTTIVERLKETLFDESGAFLNDEVRGRARVGWRGGRERERVVKGERESHGLEAKFRAHTSLSGRPTDPDSLSL
jgi:hypothetical protein